MKTIGIDDLYHPQNKVRMVTAASLFDGHDAAINIMRRLLQKGGAEIIHLGHNIPARQVVEAAVEEDARCVHFFLSRWAWSISNMFVNFLMSREHRTLKFLVVVAE